MPKFVPLVPTNVQSAPAPIPRQLTASMPAAVALFEAVAGFNPKLFTPSVVTSIKHLSGPQLAKPFSNPVAAVIASPMAVLACVYAGTTGVEAGNGRN